MLKNKWSRGAIGVAAALALGLSVASPANAYLGTPTADFPSSTSTPSKYSSRTVAGSVKFAGTAGNSNYRYYLFNSDYSMPRPKSVKRNKGVKAANVSKPYLNSASGALTPNVKNSISLEVYKYTTPGKYRLSVPVTERVFTGAGYAVQTKTDKTEYFTVKGNATTSKSLTSYSGYSNSNRTFSMSVNAPDYQSGAKVTVYYKAKGASSYKRVHVSKLKASSYSSKASFKIKSKFNLRPGGRVFVKVGAVTYAPGFKTATAKIKSY